MRYVEARIDDFKREETYRIFVTESLRLAPQHGWLVKKYTELLSPQKIDTRSGDEIAIDVIRRAGLSFNEV